MADFVGTGGGDDSRDSFSVFEAEEREENAPLFVVEDDDGDDDSDFHLPEKEKEVKRRSG